VGVELAVAGVDSFFGEADDPESGADDPDPDPDPESEDEALDRESVR
jgi:hypothetical protein